ncbi:MAG: tetratricopeptide repeat protein [Gammaproteobacteria bacterium]|nr:tetratricopeptide repeat protein [Gammaproteobacteria bacterium]
MRNKFTNTLDMRTNLPPFQVMKICRRSITRQYGRQAASVVLICSLMALLLAGCATQGPSVEPQEKTQTAEQALPKIDPKASALFEKALTAMRKDKDAVAEKQLLQLTKQFPNFSGPQVNLGIIYYRAGKYDIAREAFNKALELNPKSVASLNHLGIISRNEGKFKESSEDYEKALRINPDYAYAHRNFGILLELYMGRLPEALAHYKRYQTLVKQQNNAEDGEVRKWIVELGRRIKK